MKEHRRRVTKDKSVRSLPRIFFSHSAKDNDFGERLVADLRRVIGDNDAVWYDVSGLQGGDVWWSKIVEQLTARDVFIIVLSPESVVSRWVRRELDTAINEGKRIVPVLYQPCEVRADLKIIQIISFLSPKSYETAFNELLKALGLPEQHEVVPPPGLPVPPPKPNRRISRVQASLLVGLALLVIAGGLGLFFVLGNNQRHNAFSDATATANAYVTATYKAYAASVATIQAQVNTNATATATLEPQVNATATAFAPTVTAVTTTSQNPYPPRLGTLTLNDPLKDNTKPYGWDENHNCGFTRGAYHASGSGQSLYTCYAKSTNYTNFALQVQMTIIKEGCGGLVFRAEITGYYTFEICTDGTYSLVSYNTTGGTWLISPTTFAAINTYLNQTNVIAVVASGNKLDLYVNLEHITSVNDSSYSHGLVGVAIVGISGQSDQSEVEVAFSNAKVWKL